LEKFTLIYFELPCKTLIGVFCGVILTGGRLPTAKVGVGDFNSGTVAGENS